MSNVLKIIFFILIISMWAGLKKHTFKPIIHNLQTMYLITYKNNMRIRNRVLRQVISSSFQTELAI